MHFYILIKNINSDWFLEMWSTWDELCNSREICKRCIRSTRAAGGWIQSEWGSELQKHFKFSYSIAACFKGPVPPQNQKCITCSAIYHGLFGWESRFDIGLPFLSNVMQLDDTRLVVPNKYIWETLFHQNYTHQWTSGLLSKGIKLTSITDLLRGFWVQNQRRSPIFL